MRKIFVPVFLGLLFLLTPVFAMGATLTGTIQGFNCVVHGKTCPIGKEDPMAATENVFVLLVDAAKGDYYFLPGIENVVLVRHINEQIKVVGDVDKKYKSIKAKQILNAKGKEVWSREEEEKLMQEMMMD